MIDHSTSDQSARSQSLERHRQRQARHSPPPSVQRSRPHSDERDDPTSSSAVAPPRLPACNRCRSRKTKCDAKLPVCSPCEKAGADCVGDDRANGRPLKRSYLWHLEQKIKELTTAKETADMHSTSANSGYDQSIAYSPAQQGEVTASSSSLRPSLALQQDRNVQTRTRRSQEAPHDTVAITSGLVSGSSLASTSDTGHDNDRISARQGPLQPDERSRHVLRDRKRRAPSTSREKSKEARSGREADETTHLGSHDTFVNAANVNETYSPVGDSFENNSDADAILLTDFYRSPDHDPLSQLVHAALGDVDKPEENSRHEATDTRREAHPRTAFRGNLQETFIFKELDALRALREDILRQGQMIPLGARFDPRRYGEKLCRRLAHRYFTFSNSALPVLHEGVFSVQLDKMFNTQNSSAAHMMITHHDRFQILMVMATALASLCRNQPLGSEFRSLSTGFWKEARSYYAAVTSTGWRKLQNTLLFLQYGLLDPSCRFLWRLSGEAMRLVTEQGLYLRPNMASDRLKHPLLQDTLRRLFWSTYIIDRMLACVLGRPLSLPDEWITAEMPLLVEDSDITVQGINDGPICHLKLASLLHIKLRRIQSEIQTKLYTPKQENVPDDSFEGWTITMLDRIRRWRSELKCPTPFMTSEWVELQFHLMTMMLLRPSPRRRKPHADALRLALHSSGQAMRLYHALHRNLAINYSSIATRNLFLSGLTFLNSVEELCKVGAPLPLSLLDIALQVQSCTVVLEVLSASDGSVGAERIRDAFASASTGVLRLLAQRDRNSVFQHSSSSFHYSDENANEYALHAAYSNGHADWPPSNGDSGNAAHSAPYPAVQNFLAELQPGDSEAHFFSHDLDAVPLDKLLGLRVRKEPALYSSATDFHRGDRDTANPLSSRTSRASSLHPNGHRDDQEEATDSVSRPILSMAQGSQMEEDPFAVLTTPSVRFVDGAVDFSDFFRPIFESPASIPWAASSSFSADLMPNQDALPADIDTSSDVLPTFGFSSAPSAGSATHLASNTWHPY